MSEIETQFTQEVVCPHCGYECSDSWELRDYDGRNVECDECGEDFRLDVDYDVTYCTSKIDSNSIASDVNPK